MKKITYFFIKTCPYCRHANRAIEELTAENEAYRDIEIERICEEENPDIVKNYDYYYVPCMYIGTDKIYEADPSQGYDEIRNAVKNVMDLALQD
ncbi:MAG: glutaredoxin [Oscillospiraceae bacterium]|jgi:glutaredoxin|nr:glutaredoxin [Oscillospiraceae bacterium]MBQ5342535.1 glutaredoxin [Oscillospiraceae bacterium]